MKSNKEIEAAIFEYGPAFEEEFQMPLKAAIDLYDRGVLKTEEVIDSDEFAAVWVGVMGNTWKEYEYSYLEFASLSNKLIALYKFEIPNLNWKKAKEELIKYNLDLDGSIEFLDYSFKCASLRALAKNFVEHLKNSSI